MKPIIEVQHVSKTYQLSKRRERYLSLRDNIFSFTQRSNKDKETFQALQDISFSLQPGETLGVIGQNGAGKSTLLKVISKITPPTSGKIIMRGRVSSLLEVGTGFHPELTGRENIFLNGSILGLLNQEIKTKFDEIVDFSGVEQFLDTPVKHFSTGMQMRLAFSVAAHLEPEILVIDEVLSVGDAKFQQKCIGKMEEVANNQGRTIIFVSHDLSSVAKLTSKSILLDHGKIKSMGPTNEVINDYKKDFSLAAKYHSKNDSKEKPFVKAITINTNQGTGIQGFLEAMEVIFNITVPVSLNGLALSYQIMNLENQPVSLQLVVDSDLPFGRTAGNYILKSLHPKIRLAPGKYFLKVHFANQQTGEKYETLDAICPFEVINLGQTRSYKMVQGEAFYYEDNEWSIGKTND